LISSADADGASAEDDAPGAADVAGVDAPGLLADGLAAPWHAANTTIVLANRPINRFRI
jgi:hypothetical protein